MMNYLKIVSKGWAGYTGQLNMISFENGISTEPVVQVIADRIAAAVQVVAVDADGNELPDVAVGIQARLVSEASARAERTAELVRQTEAEKKKEAKLDASKRVKAPIERIYTTAELEEIADKGGIKALREIADGWGVKSRSIPTLIGLILREQQEFERARLNAIRNAGKDNRRHTLPGEEVRSEEKVEEAVPEVAGVEGMADSYFAGAIEIPAATILTRALELAGMTLTGWNKMPEAKREPYVREAMSGIAAHYSVELTTKAPEADDQASSNLSGSKSEPDAEHVPATELDTEGLSAANANLDETESRDEDDSE